MKRFYKMVSISPRGNGGGFGVHLDGRPIKTPQKQELHTPHEAIATLIMSEWADQKEEIIPETMPVTQLLTTALDIVPKGRPDMTDQIMRYLDTDLVCYPAPEPEQIVTLQNERWNPVRACFEKDFAVILHTTTGLSALSQDKAAHQKLRGEIEAMDDLHFTLFQSLVPLAGSMILAWCFYRTHIDVEGFDKACFAEEDYKAELYQADKYGHDPLLEKTRAALVRDADAVAKCLAILKS
jgi:chaperone required for assembly of F1-ATPase